MNNNNLTGVILGAIIIVAIVGGVIWYNNGSDIGGAGDNAKGSLYVGVTDATADISNVNEINMEVKKVEVHSAAKGWVTVSAQSKKYNLLALKASAKTELYAKADIQAGVYDRVRVTVGDTVVKTKANGDIKAHSPSRQVVMNMDINVEAESETMVKLDFLADKSLHSAKNNQFVFAPVVKAESQSNTTVTVSDQDAMTHAGGKLDSSVSVGVDIDGRSKTNFNLTSGSDLEVDSSGLGAVKFMLGGKTYTETEINHEESVDANANINTSVNSDTQSGSSSVDLNGMLDLDY